MIGRIVNPGENVEERKFLGVQSYDPVQYLEKIRMQSYTLANAGIQIIPASNLLRKVHIVPMWNTIIEEERDNVDVYARYENFVLNSHSDQASWNYFY